ncbi:fatty acid/phospholipid synthesis protein PlsX [Gemmatimonas aurantiaca T-27]|uniref:Phosphate acyltransferase n=1 Tax=Gemmatimonas aurantiaca (strain DSM 14586 / JCM 11422 / NBRC 100505 / T-27) TaxID=379066 RepID=C1A8X2_GEMAT|nr:phosphate acyltransferase PlsX [Gemmatimonas aurantiaca]BAH38682.1 fatty acid/phospholipid synthesis protein PlsX [Gemmatimonas aurantiaca T-27]
MARIAVDAMGGDFAPRAPIAGALHALGALPPHHEIELVGQTAVIESELDALLRGELAELAHVRDRITIVEAPDVIEMSDKPSAALRRKPNSSMVVGVKRVADGVAHGFVSAGSTGAQMAVSFMLLKLHPGLTRPAIGAIFPSMQQPLLVLDVGANVDCAPAELVQFARIGTVYAKALLGRENPAVGLLSVGEEAEKGNLAVKDAHQLLLNAGLNFIGNVEGRDLPRGVCDRGPIDVVVCDGFTGNVLLKFYESIGPMLIGMVSKVAQLDPRQVMGSLKQFDVDEYGGSPLLGVRGVSIISHGKSSPKAIKNAIAVAIRAWESGMTDEIGRRLAESVPDASDTGSAT